MPGKSSAQNRTAFRWTAPRQRAALLVAADDLTDENIATELDIARRTLADWKTHPDFAARVNEHRETWRKEVRNLGIAERQNRVDALNDRWHRMRAVIDARAEDHADVPGGDTGLLVKQERAIGTGQNQTIIIEYAVDTGLLRELRAHEQQAAQELGQWSDKTDHAGDITIRVVYDDADNQPA